MTSARIDLKSVFVIVPSFNEETVLRNTITGILATGYRCVVVDDGSARPQEQVLKGLPVCSLRHAVNLGQGAALETGFRFALSRGAGYIVTFDADGQHRVEDLDTLLHVLQQEQADIVLGSRFLPGSGAIPKPRKRLLQLARLASRLFTGLWLTDAHNGLRAMTAGAARQIRLRENGMAHATELVAEIRRHRLRWKEVPVSVRYTEYARGKGQKAPAAFRILFDLLLSKFFR